MIGALPPRPTGSDAAARFMQWVWDSLQSLRVTDTPGALVNRTTRGFSVVPTARGGGGAKIEVSVCDPSTGEVKLYALVGRDITPAA